MCSDPPTSGNRGYVISLQLVLLRSITFISLKGSLQRALGGLILALMAFSNDKGKIGVFLALLAITILFIFAYLAIHCIVIWD